MTAGLPTGPVAPPRDGRATAPWITLQRRAPLIEADSLSKQTRPALGKGFTAYGADKGTPDTWQVKSSAHCDEIHDFITADLARGQSGIFQSDKAIVYRNVDARLCGARLDAMTNLDANWSSRFLAAFTYGDNLTDDRALYQVAPLEAEWSLDYGEKVSDRLFWHAGLKLRMVARQTRVDASKATGLGQDTGSETGGFATLDLYGGVSLDPDAALGFGVSNVADKTYREHVNAIPQGATTRPVNAPGRAFWAQLTLAF